MCVSVGVIYIGDKPIPGAVDVVHNVKKMVEEAYSD